MGKYKEFITENALDILKALEDGDLKSSLQELIKDLVKCEVYQDTDPGFGNPREDDNLGRMHCAHRRYNMGDADSLEDLSSVMEAADVAELDSPVDTVKLAEKEGLLAALLPIYMYDHGNLVLSDTPFGCAFDSGLLGFTYVTKDAADEEYGEGEWTTEQVEDLLRSELKCYDAYIQGEVYGYILESDVLDIHESCGGFLNSDAANTKEVMLEYVDDELHFLIAPKIDEMIY